MDTLKRFMQMSLKAKLAIILVVVFVVSMAVQILFFPSSLPLGSVAPGNLRKWESQLGKFSLDYPENWTVLELPDGNHGDKEVIAMLLPKNNNFPQVLISQKDFSSGNINDVAAWAENRNQQRGTYKSMKLESLKTSSITGQTREYTITFDSLLGTKPIRCLDLYALKDEFGYQLAFCANESDWPKMSVVFQQMIQSFAFIQP